MESEPGSCKLINVENVPQYMDSKVDLSNVTLSVSKKKKILFKRCPWKRKNSGQNYKKKQVSIGHVFYLFCSTTSIRGMNKIPKGPIFLRVSWFLFVLFMTTGLIVATTFMVIEYLQYDVNVYTKIILDDNTSFPALTICHHHPFSLKAYDLWNKELVISPSKYNKFLRNVTNSIFKNNLYGDGVIVSNFDTMSMYYQNLKLNESVLVGHDKQTYLTCMNQLSFIVNFDDDCSKLRNISFHRVSYHEYFNCHTFQPEDINVSYLLDSINIVVSLEPKPDYQKHEQAFVVETFQRAEGLRVVVHETNSYPDIAQDGIHVEPGKMNEIKYQPILHKRVDTPAKPCVQPGDIIEFKDLDNKFLMDKKNCISQRKQELIIEQCKCIFVSLPRPMMPTQEIPYCGEIPRDINISLMKSRIDCIDKIVTNPDFQKDLENNACFPRCDVLTFESTVSITKWGATAWHLHWIRLTNKAIDLAKTNMSMRINDTLGYKMWLDYANKENLSDIQSLRNDHFLKDENFAYVVLQRKSRNTILKQEKLVTTPYVLVSRVGGVCSLTIGLTAAFIVEFIEFIYRFCTHNKENVRFNQTKGSTKYDKYIKSTSNDNNMKNLHSNIQYNNQIPTIAFKDSTVLIQDTSSNPDSK